MVLTIQYASNRKKGEHGSFSTSDDRWDAGSGPFELTVLSLDFTESGCNTPMLTFHQASCAGENKFRSALLRVF